MWKRQLWRKVALTKFFSFQESYNFYFKILFPYLFNRFFLTEKFMFVFLDMMVHSLCHRKKSGTNLLLRPRRNQKTTLLWRKFIVLTSHRDAPISTKTFTECTERYLTYKYLNKLFSESYLLYLRSVSRHNGAKFYLKSKLNFVLLRFHDKLSMLSIFYTIAKK